MLLHDGSERVDSSRQVLGREMVSIRCLHGDTVLYPLADVQLVMEGITVKVEAAVAERLPAEVIFWIRCF